MGRGKSRLREGHESRKSEVGLRAQVPHPARQISLGKTLAGRNKPNPKAKSALVA